MAVASSCHAHKVLVHPVALFSVLDAYQRRPEEGRRIIGTLMGVAEKGTVEVKAAFVVPHQEPDEVRPFTRRLFERVSTTNFRKCTSISNSLRIWWNSTKKSNRKTLSSDGRAKLIN